VATYNTFYSLRQNILAYISEERYITLTTAQNKYSKKLGNIIRALDF